VAFEKEGILSIALKLMLSTGDPGTRHTTYDCADVGRHGAALPVEDIDVDRFEEVEASIPEALRVRDLAFFEPVKLADWLGSELAVIGWVVGSRETPDGHQITLDRATSPLLVGLHDLTEDDVTPEPWPSQVSHRSEILNRAELSLVWNPGKGEFEKAKFQVNDLDSQQDNGTTATIKLEARGLRVGVGGAAVLATSYGFEILSLYSKRYRIVTLGITKRGWAFKRGDHVRVTLAKVVQGETVRVWDDAPMTVLGVKRTLVGSGTAGTCTLTLLHVPSRRLSYYCPTARIGDYDAGVPEITLDANIYSSAAQVVPWTDEAARDPDFFETGMVVRVCNQGDEAAAVERTLGARAGDTFEISAPLPVGMGVDSVVTFPSWDSCDDWQQLFVHVADDGGTLGAGADDPFQFA
jgi:hypothetical protein